MSVQIPTRIDIVPNACGQRYITTHNLPTPCLWAGIIVGLSSAAIGEIIGFLPNGHKINDPILLALSIPRIFQNGLLYFNWQGVIITVVYAIIMGVAAGKVAQLLANRNLSSLSGLGAQQAAKSAIWISVAPIVFQELSGLQVLLWYGIAAWITSYIAKLVAKQTVKYF